MTTTVVIATSGNKAVKLNTPNGEMILQPGRWTTLGIHGDQSISVQETGEFVNVEQGAQIVGPTAG